MISTGVGKVEIYKPVDCKAIVRVPLRLNRLFSEMTHMVYAVWTLMLGNEDKTSSKSVCWVCIARDVCRTIYIYLLALKSLPHTYDDVIMLVFGSIPEHT